MISTKTFCKLTGPSRIPFQSFHHPHHSFQLPLFPFQRKFSSSSTTTDAPPILYSEERGGRVGVLTLNNHKKRNSLSHNFLSQLTEALDRLQAKVVESQQRQQSFPPPHLLILASSSPVFSAGHDLVELTNSSEEKLQEIFSQSAQLCQKIHSFPLPVIAEVRGIATAAGLQLLLSCDMAVAEENATFSTPGVGVGLFCTTPGVALARKVPQRKAMEMLLTGKSISATDALAYGIINRIAPASPPSALRETSLGLADEVLKSSAAVISLGKQAFYKQIEMNEKDAYHFASSVMVKNISQIKDTKEGIKAFKEKRTPQWDHK